MIFYYTRTQKSRIAAEALGEITGQPLYALESDINDSKGLRFAWQAVRSVIGAKGCPVKNMPVGVPGEIYLCGPVWMGAIAGPLNYFINSPVVSGVKVHLLLTCMQPTEETRASAYKRLTKAGCVPGKVYMIATSKQPPEKEVVIEHLRELMAE
jgi:hypothetical protein